MKDHERSSSEEIARLGDRLRSAVEIQGILRDDPAAVTARARSAERAAPAAKEAPRAEEVPPPEVVPPDGSAPPASPRPASAPPPAAVVTASVGHPWQGDPRTSGSLGELHESFQACRRCPLCETRTEFVFGVGSPTATVMFVGEAPGRDEDLQGEPFVGRAGKLLDKILEAIGWSRNDVYIANILKCRPPGNRNPEPAEIAQCEPVLQRQIELIRPVILCTLGSIATKTLLGTTQGIGKLRGTLHEYHGTPLVATYHPAALLRNPNWKRPTWEDVQMLRNEHDRLLKESGRGPE